MSNFQLNFKSESKLVTITLDQEEGIFDLALLFKKMLDDAGIANTLEEAQIEAEEADQESEESV
jgi:hypothetical protein